MKILKIISQHRRDFRADMVCENCGNVEKDVRGYDDRNFHDNVIPSFKCNKCGKSRNDLGIEGEFTQTKYEAWETV